MMEKIEINYINWRKISAVIEEKTKERDKVLNSLLKTKVGELYFSLNDKQKELFEEIYSDSNFTRYIYLQNYIKEYQEILDEVEVNILTHEDFPFKNEGPSIYINDGIDTYNALIDESTKDMDKITKEVVGHIISKIYDYEEEIKASDIPLIKVIYSKLVKNGLPDFEDLANITMIEDEILRQVERIHKLDKRLSTYIKDRSEFIEKLKESIKNDELEIKNSNSNFKGLLLFSIESIKYEISLLEGKRVTAILKEIEESSSCKKEADYKIDALVKAYYNLTDIDFRKQSGYFSNENDICYATFETADFEVNTRILKMMKR